MKAEYGNALPDVKAWAKAAGKAVFAVIGNWSADRCSSMAAALAFYAAFSLAPLLVIVTAVAGVFFGPDAVQGRLYSEIESLLGKDGALVVQTMLASAWKTGRGPVASWLSVGAIMVGATATFAELSSALQTIWRTPPPAHQMAELIRVRLISFGLVVGAGFMLVVLLIADTFITFATSAVLGGDLMQPVAGTIEQTVSLFFLCTVFTALLKVLPDTHVRGIHAVTGGVATALLFSGGKHLFAIYLAHAGTANVFGVASSLAILMMWLFFSASVFLLGAELAAYLARAAAPSGARAAPSSEPSPRLSRRHPQGGEMPWLLR